MKSVVKGWMIRHHAGRGGASFNLYRALCDIILIYDNSTTDPRLVASISGSKTTIVRPDLFKRIVNAECEGK